MFPLREFLGRVVDIYPIHKAIVEFKFEGKTERALLWYDKIKINGDSLPQGGSIVEYIQKDTLLKFMCHDFDDSGTDRCGWYITSAWRQEACDMDLTTTAGDTVISGLYNCPGTVQELAQRQGILSYSLNGKNESVMFLGSKVWIDGRRLKTKESLSSVAALEEGRPLLFDAVPTEPQDQSDIKYCWFATVVWKGRKPLMDYDQTRNKNNKDLSHLEEMKRVTSNPHSIFLRTTGQVMKIVSPEYGLALARIQNNRWETVLFHRSQATVFELSLAEEDLTKVFAEGDKLRIIAAAAPKTMGVRWVASQVRVFVHPSIAHKYQF